MWKWIPAIIAVLVSLAAWSLFAAGVILHLGFDKPTFIAIATVGALTLEGAVWMTAAALGVTVFQARKRIWAKLSGRSSQGA